MVKRADSSGFRYPRRVRSGLHAWLGSAGWGVLLIAAGCFIPVPELEGVCRPGEALVCYEGPEGTRDQGLCKAGTGACSRDAQGVDSCDGQVLPATESCVSQEPEDEDCDGVVNDYCASWSRQLGGAGADFVQAVAVDPTGDAYSGGRFGDEIVFAGETFILNGGQGDGFIARHAASDGAPVWAKHIEGPGEQSVQALLGRPSRLIFGGFAGGRTDIDATSVDVMASQGLMLGALDPVDGAVQWLQVWGDDGAYGRIHALAPRAGGGVIAGGYVRVGADFGGTMKLEDLPNDAAVTLAVDDTGQPQWLWSGGGDTQARTEGVAVADDGAVFAAGFFRGTLGSGCPEDLVSADDDDGFLLRLDPDDGRCLWSYAVEGTGSQRVRGVLAVDDELILAIDVEGSAVLPDGINYTPGGDRHLFVVRIDRDGELVWLRRFPATRKIEAFQLAPLPDGGLVIGGSAEGTIEAGETPLTSQPLEDDAYIIGLDGKGKTLFARMFGGNGDDDVISVATGTDADGTNYLYIGGEVTNTMDLGQGPLAVPGDDDQYGWIARIGM